MNRVVLYLHDTLVRRKSGAWGSYRRDFYNHSHQPVVVVVVVVVGV